MTPFKAYDIRGRVGPDLDEPFAEHLGRAFADYLAAATVVVGRDMRPSSKGLAQALVRGLRRQGTTVVDLGLVSTPMTYFANTQLGADGSIMVTASHNPPGDNGFKLSRADAIPIGGETGLADIARLLTTADFLPGCCHGAHLHHDIRPAYAAMARAAARFSHRPRIVCDFANAVGSLEIDGLRDLFEIIPLYEELDGTFPHHLANPLLLETLADLQAAVRRTGAAFGVAFDGDADRLGLVDETGAILPPDIVFGLLCEEALQAGPTPIVHDVRTSRGVRDRIRTLGGNPIVWKVGHANIKPKMRELGARFGGELAGHCYFGELANSESTALSLVWLANLQARRQLPMSALAAPFQTWANSGEINLDIGDAARIATILAHLRRTCPGHQHELDGLTVEHPDWWFNLRPSNTEPLLRLILEARTPAALAAHRRDLLTLIRETP